MDNKSKRAMPFWYRRADRSNTPTKPAKPTKPGAGQTKGITLDQYAAVTDELFRRRQKVLENTGREQ